MQGVRRLGIALFLAIEIAERDRCFRTRRFGGDQILIWVQVSGESDVNYAGRDGKLRPGDVAILDYAREIFVRAPDFASIYVMIERSMVPSAFLAPSMHGTIFAADSGPGRILCRAVEALCGVLRASGLAG